MTTLCSSTPPLTLTTTMLSSGTALTSTLSLATSVTSTPNLASTTVVPSPASLTITGFASAHGKTNTELDLVIAIKDGASVNLTTTGLQQIRIPFGDNTILHGEASGGNGRLDRSSPPTYDLPTVNTPLVVLLLRPPNHQRWLHLHLRLPSFDGSG